MTRCSRISTPEIQQNSKLTLAGAVADVDNTELALLHVLFVGNEAVLGQPLVNFVNGECRLEILAPAKDGHELLLVPVMNASHYFHPAFAIDKINELAQDGLVADEEDMKLFHFFAVEAVTRDVLKQYSAVGATPPSRTRCPGASGSCRFLMACSNRRPTPPYSEMSIDSASSSLINLYVKKVHAGRVRD